jgi:hypothetical protein
MAECKYHGHYDDHHRRCPKCRELEKKTRAEEFAQRTPVETRWLALQSEPEDIMQDAFGICGTPSIVYLLLTGDDRSKTIARNLIALSDHRRVTESNMKNVPPRENGTNAGSIVRWRS